MIDAEEQVFTVAQARKSTLVVAVVLGLIAAWQAYKGRNTAVAVLLGAAVLLVMCAAIPPAALWFNKWWMRLAGVLGYINSRILLSLLFFLVMTPIGFVLRMTGYDPLARHSGNEPSYWRRRAATRQTREGFERAY